MTLQKTDLRSLADCLLSNPQLASLGEEVITDLAAHTRLMHFNHNDRLLGKGDEMRYAAVIVRGGIRSSLVGYDGCEMSISILRRGAFYGWMSIAQPTSSPWDIYANGQTILASIFASDFRMVMSRHQELSALLINALNVRLRKTYDLMSNLVLSSPQTRLRRMLVLMAGDRSKFGKNDVPNIKVTQEELGNFIQCSRVTVNKLLKELETAGLIEIGYGQITIRDLDGLTSEIELEDGVSFV